jgi:hypothetical protein
LNASTSYRLVTADAGNGESWSRIRCVFGVSAEQLIVPGVTGTPASV